MQRAAAHRAAAREPVAAELELRAEQAVSYEMGYVAEFGKGNKYSLQFVAFSKDRSMELTIAASDDPARYRPLMPIAVLEKAGFVAIVAALHGSAFGGGLEIVTRLLQPVS